MPMTFQQAVAAYRQHLIAQGKSLRTQYTYGKDLEQILAFWGPERLVHTVSVPLIGRFLKSDALLKLPSGARRAARTITKTQRVFRMFLHFCESQGWLVPLVLPKVLQVRPAPQPHPIQNP